MTNQLTVRSVHDDALAAAEMVAHASVAPTQIERASDWLRSLGLEVTVEPATDPFFGSAAWMMGAMQRVEQLKWELVRR